MLSRPIPGEIYKHFKGKLYRIVTLAQHSETGEEMVIYQALYGEYQVYARPLAMFLEDVDREKYPEILQKKRFEKVSELVAPLFKGSDQETGRSAADNLAEDIEPIEDRKPAKEIENIEGRKPAEDIENHRRNVQEYQVESTVTQMSESKMTKEMTSMSCEEEVEELQLDPLVLEFLDAGSYEERIRILTALHHRITNEMITTMALAIDLEIGDGDVEDRYGELKNCLCTFERYEGSRLR